MTHSSVSANPHSLSNTVFSSFSHLLKLIPNLYTPFSLTRVCFPILYFYNIFYILFLSIFHISPSISNSHHSALDYYTWLHFKSLTNSNINYQIIRHCSLLICQSLSAQSVISHLC